MEITLLPETVRRIRAALESEVDLSPAAVPAALSRLAVEAPAVYSQVLTELSGSQIRLDSERELQRRHRRGMVRRALFWWGEYESDAGDRLIAKRRVAAAVPFVIAGFIMILWGVSGMVAHPVRAPVRAGVTHAKSTSGASLGSGPALGAVRRALLPAHAWVASLPAARGPVPAFFTPQPSNRTPSTPGNPVVFDRQQAPVRTMTIGLLPGSASTPAPVVYDRGANEGGPARLDASVAEGNPPATSAQAGSRWMPGQRVAAHLATGVVVMVGGPPMPVIAESDGPGATWLGQATVGAEGLVQVTFTLASSGRQGGVRGIALDPARLVPGLAGRMTLRHPHAAAAVMAAALQAAGDYVQALARQGEATLADGWTQLALGQTAPAWTYAASRLARVIDPGVGTGGPVETAEIAGGSRLTILVTEAP